MERSLGLFADMAAARQLAEAMDHEFGVSITFEETDYDDYEILMISKSPNLAKYKYFGQGFLAGWYRYENQR